MGERLVVEFRDGTDKIATIYQHWSGYTSSTLLVYNNLAKWYREDPIMTDFTRPFEERYKHFMQNLATGKILPGAYMTKPNLDLDLSNYLTGQKTVKQVTRDVANKGLIDRNEGLVDFGSEALDALDYAEHLLILDFNPEAKDIKNEWPVEPLDLYDPIYSAIEFDKNEIIGGAWDDPDFSDLFSLAEFENEEKGLNEKAVRKMTFQQYIESFTSADSLGATKIATVADPVPEKLIAAADKGITLSAYDRDGYEEAVFYLPIA